MAKGRFAVLYNGIFQRDTDSTPFHIPASRRTYDRRNLERARSGGNLIELDIGQQWIIEYGKRSLTNMKKNRLFDSTDRR